MICFSKLATFPFPLDIGCGMSSLCDPVTTRWGQRCNTGSGVGIFRMVKAESFCSSGNNLFDDSSPYSKAPAILWRKYKREQVLYRWLVIVVVLWFTKLVVWKLSVLSKKNWPSVANKCISLKKCEYFNSTVDSKDAHINERLRLPTRRPMWWTRNLTNSFDKWPV